MWKNQELKDTFSTDISDPRQNCIIFAKSFADNMLRICIHHIILCAAVFLLAACHAGRSGPDADGRDSVYTTGYIEKISFGEPQRALALLDTAEERRLFTPFETNLLRCLVNHNGLSRYRAALFYGRKAYADPEARKHPDRLLPLLSYMAEDSHTNGDYGASVRYCAEGLKLAREQGSKTYEADFHVTWAKNLMIMAQHGEAFRHFDLGIGLLEEEASKDASYHAWDELFYSLGLKLSSLYEVDRDEEAYAMAPRMEEALKGLEASKDAPDGLAELRRAELLAVLCPVAYATGRREDGDRLYRQLEANPVASTPDGEYIRIPGLVAAGRFDEALRYVRREKKLLQANTDTVNWDYINPHLQAELEAWQGKGDVREVARVQAAMLALTDTLRHRERCDDALQWTEIYESEEKDARIKEEQQNADRWMVIALAVTVVMLVGGSLGYVIVRKNRGISRRSLALVAQVKRQLADRRELDGKMAENLALRDRLEQLAKELEKERAKTAPKGERPKKSVAPEDGGGKLTDMDSVLFERMVCEIKNRELFRDPDFSRVEMLKIVPVPQNKFADMFIQFAGMSFYNYVQNLRLDYASELLIYHPDWSIDAVIKESGMSRSTFYSSWKAKFGVKPEEFRKNGQKTGEDGGLVTD